MTPIEFGIISLPLPGRAVAAAIAAEEDGYDVVLMPDSQNLYGDPYTQLALIANATSRIRMGPGVTNPVTRHPAVTAASIVSVQAESCGRAILGMGRGDSSLLHIGLEPASMKTYAKYVREVQTYLGGGEVDQKGFSSRIRWLEGYDLPKVPLDMACTGPKSIALAAATAERVTFAVGAAPERVQWALDVAKTAATEAGRDPDEIQFGAYINAVAMPDRDAARRALRGVVATFAHFSGGTGTVFEGQPDMLRRVSEKLHDTYDTRQHGQADAVHAKIIDDQFIDWFSVAGPPDYVIERLRTLMGLGLNHIYFVGAFQPTSRELFAREVLPVLRE
jgi:5,10-methylenetetrahydromethanopterin reductase